jgi:pimeloyl-ACP methyl ester carboxylesterase
VREAVWATNIATDPVGAKWGQPPYHPVTSPLGGVVRGGMPAKTIGWNAEAASRVTAPVMLITGEHDLQQSGEPWPDEIDLYNDLATAEKVRITIGCAGHFVHYERPHNILHALAIEWLNEGTALGRSEGVFKVDEFGRQVD